MVEGDELKSKGELLDEIPARFQGLIVFYCSRRRRSSRFSSEGV
jgi:hypothetical protein